MNKINKFLILFVVLLVVVVTTIWNIISSPYFVEMASSRVNEVISERFNAEVSFSGYDFSVIPLRSTLYNVNVKKYNEFSVKMSRVDLNFTLWSLFKSDFNISGVSLYDGYVKIDKVKQSDSGKSFDIKKVNIFKIYKDKVISQIPFEIELISLNEIDVQYDKKVFEISSLDIMPYDLSLDITGEIKNLSFDKYFLDKLSFSFELDQSDIRIIDLSVERGLSRISMVGEVSHEANRKFKAQVIHNGYLSDLGFPSYLYSGRSENLFNIKGDLNDYEVSFKGETKDLKSRYANVDHAKYDGNYKDRKITLTKLEAKVDNGKVKLLKPSSLSLDSYVLVPPLLRLTNVSSHDILYFLGDKFKILDTTISGDVQIEYEDEILRIRTMSIVSLSDLSLGYENKILDFDQGGLYDTRIEIYEDLINISSSVQVLNQPLEISGFIDSEEVDLNLYTEDFRVSTLGGAIGRSVAGVGNVELDFKGPIDDVSIISSSLELNDLNILDYEVRGKSVAELEYVFNTSKLKVSDFELPRDLGEVSGFIDFKNQEIDISFDIKKISTSEVPEILKPHWKQIGQYVSIFRGQANAKILLKGEFDDLIVSGNVSSEQMSIYSEILDSLEATLEISKEQTSIRGATFRKKDASVSGDIIVSREGLKSLNLSVSGVELDEIDKFRSLGLNYRGLFNGSLNYSLAEKSPKGSGRFILLRSQIGQKKIRPSVLALNLEDSLFTLESSLFGDRINIDSKIYVGEKKSNRSEINIKAFISDLKTLLGIVSTENIYNTSLGGDIKASLNTSFSLDKPDVVDLDLQVSRFFLRYFDKEVSLMSPGIIKVKDSSIEKMEIDVGGTGGTYTLRGEGGSELGYKIEQNFNIDLSYVSIFTSAFKRIGGIIQGRGVLSGKLDNLKNYHELSGRRIDIRSKKEIGLFTNGSFSSVLNDSIWNFENIRFDYEGGKIAGEGEVTFQLGFPKLLFNIVAKDVSLKPVDGAKIYIDSSLELTGKRIPYLINGSLNVNGGDVESDLTEFQDGSKYLKSVSKYISNDANDTNEIIVADIDVKTSESVHVKNRLTDMFLLADFNISGAVSSPELVGEISVVPDVSKFKFKGNDFVINNGRILLTDGTATESVSLNFESRATVSDYLVKMKIIGATDDLKISLDSEPSLSQDDIFSLLTLGFTQDLSKNLESKDKTSITTISLGTMLVDQLKINDGLDSTLGLKLSVLPEFTESDESPIEASRSDQQSKVKTATKLRIQKKITKDLDFTFSNTFGGDANQKQEMNIDYNLNNEWSIQGVFENVTDPDETGEENSAGADVKYKWTF